MFKKKWFKWILISLVGSIFLMFGYTKFYGLNTNDVALEILSGLKTLQGESVELDFLENDQSKVISHASWSELLAKYVRENGDVNYMAFQEDVTQLNQYLDLLSQNPPGSNQSQNQQLAFWINAYNAFTIKLILDHYPLQSIKDISDGLPMLGSPWDIKFFKMKDIDVDLNTIEHDILRKRFDEPRIHFAINCASFSCPKLRAEAFTAKNLAAQLEEQSRAFLNNPTKNVINEEESKLSMIFNWFQRDFKKVGGVKAFVQKYNDQFQTENTIEYLEYNWTLNNEISNTSGDSK